MRGGEHDGAAGTWLALPSLVGAGLAIAVFGIIYLGVMALAGVPEAAALRRRLRR